MPTYRTSTFRDRCVMLFTSSDRLSQRDFGLAIFLFTIAVLFTGGLLAYTIVRLSMGQTSQPINLVIPPMLWLSTALLVLGSLSIHRSLHYVKLEKQQQFRNCLNITFLFGGAFFVIQSLGLISLMQQHGELLLSLDPEQRSYRYLSSYGMLFAFVLLHALHFLVAFGVLGYVIYKAYLYQYDHEYYWGVHACSVVWHFLGVIWICMLLLFCFVG